MRIEDPVATVKNPPERFAGDVWLDTVVIPHDGDQRTTAAFVHFAPGARTAWHSHARGQYLRVIEGVAQFGSRDGTVLTAHPGQTVYTPPGEEHWHGAAPDSFMTHLAVLEAGDDPERSTVWREHVTDAQYEGR